MVAVAVERLPKIFLACKIDSTGSFLHYTWGRTRHIRSVDWLGESWTLLREARFGVLLAIAAALGRSLSEVGAVLIVGGNIRGHTRVLTTAIVLETSKGEFGFALALGAILVGLALLLNLALMRLQQKMST